MIDSSYSLPTDNLLTGISMPGVRLMRAYFQEARYELVRTLRMPAFAGPFLLLPAALYLFFGVVLSGGNKDPNVARFIFAAFAAFGVMGPGMFGFGIFVANEREQGLLTLRRALPAPPAAYLLAKGFMTLLFAILVMATMIAAAATLGHLRLPAGQFLSLALINIVGTLPFCAIGLFIGSRASSKSAPAFVNLAYLPMIYLSGFFFPLPKSIHWIEFMSPAFYLDQLALKSIGVHVSGSTALYSLVLIGFTVLFGLFALRRLQRKG